MRTGEPMHCYSEFCVNGKKKSVNDQYGHETGDQYIQMVRDVLKFVVDQKGVCIRWGGDEFLVITPNCGGKDHEELLQEMEAAQQKLSDLKPGMGLALGGMVRETMEIPESVVMKQADQKMYENKKSSR